MSDWLRRHNARLPLSWLLAANLALPALALPSLGCDPGDGSGGSAGTKVAPDSSASSGTCGRKVGDLVCDLDLMGYDQPSGDPPVFPAFSMELKLSKLIAESPKPYVLLLLAGAWCPSCKLATIMAVKRYDEINDRIRLVNVLIEGDKPTQPARKSHIDTWRKKYQTHFAVVTDGFESPMKGRELLGLREAALLVEQSSGKVVARADTLALLWPKLADFPAK